MSFRGDDQRRYGHVPPVQYPIPGTQASNIGRRPSFNDGDDAAYYSQPQPQDRAPAFGATQPNSGADELFLTSPTNPNPSAGRGGYASPTSALSGYQHQYNDPSPAPPAPAHAAYNPRNFQSGAQGGFQRSQSTQLPYHPHPSSRYSAVSSNPYNASSPTSYTPAAYNPAAYASAPQRQPTYHGYSSPDQGYGAQRPPSSYGQSPVSTYSPSISQMPQHSPSLSQGYQAPQQQSPGYSANNGGYDPSQYTTGGQYAQQGLNGTTTAQYPMSSQAPYPATSQMPVGPNYATQDRNSFYSRSSRSNSQTSPLASPGIQPQSSPGLQRHPTRAPLPSRPMDDLPEDSRWHSGRPTYDDDDYAYDNLTQESIMQDIEAELDRVSPGPSPRPANGRRQEPEQLHRLDSTASSQYMSNTSSLGHSSSHSSSTRPLASQPVYEEDDDDDPEGTAGVLAMQQAELDDRRFSSNAFGFADMPAVPAVPAQLPPQPEEQTQSSDSDFGGMDLGMLSGGYPGNLTYGNEYGTSPGRNPSVDLNRPLPARPGYTMSNDTYERAPALHNAEIDYGGTGGLQPPTAHRLSFDEGEERVSIHSRQSGTESPTKEDYQELFYHPGISNRPLPRLPPAPESDSSSMLSINPGGRGYYQNSTSMGPSNVAANMSADDSRLQPAEYDPYNRSASPQYPERSISMNSHSNTPLVQAPARSRTDAAEERKKFHRQQQMLSQPGSAHPDQDTSTPASVGAFDGITLPTGRKKKFVPSKLSSGDFRRCSEPWALSGIEAWVREMAEGEQDLREKKVEEALINLFVHKVATMNVADAEALSNRVVNLMLESGTLEPDEEWVKFGSGHISGVLWQLTGSGCYAPKLHNEEISGRCYSYHCTRTLKKVDLEDPDLVKSTDDWHVYYHLKKEDWESKPKKEVDRQNILHEIVTGEDNYIKQLDIFRTLYRDDLRTRNPPVLHPDRRDKFLTAVFGKLDTVLRINKENLLSQLKYRQQEQGPWITGFSDLFREWIRKAKSDYVEYATGYPRAVYMVRKEQDRNLLFKKFLEDKLKHKSSSKHDWTHFLIAPLQRLQRYVLLLESVDHKMIGDSEEKTNLQKAIQEIKAVAMDCDAKVDETNKRVEMMELDRMLVLRPGFQSVLNLDHLGRELIIQGELQRMGSRSVRWIDTHALLFDHYLILAKVVKDTRGEKKYDISKEPIPMPLLFLESMNEEPVMKQRGVVAPLGRNVAAQVPNAGLSRVTTNGTVRPGLEHSTTTTSLNSMNSLAQTNSNSDEKILFPFKVKHLGHEVYTLYASSARDRMDWCTRIVETKTRHAKALFSQNAEPFRLRVLADAAFHYEPTSMHARAVGVPVKGTPLDRAIEDLENVLGSGQGIAPVCRAQVNCASGFTAFGKAIIAIGTDYGVFISDPSNPRGWTRTVQATRVTQIAVLEEFNVCLIITDKSLVSYPLDVVAPISEFAPPVNDNPRRAPQRLAKDVTYFATARMKDRMLVFYKRKESLHTTFKVLEPILHKSSEKKSRLFGGRKGASSGTDTFRDYDEFFFPTECYSLSLFQSYIAVSTAKGIEMLTLDKKQPMSIPDLKAPSIANIASRIRDQRPLGMFRLNDNEFILTYEDCAVYVDKHGDVSRTLIMEYTGKQKKARSATMYGQYLLLFNDDYVEVRNAENGRLRQIIAGRDVRVLDLGIRGPTGGNASTHWEQTHGANGGMNTLDASKGTVKIAMSHPELQGRQIVLEMLLNDGHTETS